MTQRCADHRCIVVAQDTTEFDFTHMKEAKGLGPLNDEARRGFFMHSLYAVSEQGLPLGLLESKIVMRTEEEFRSASKRKVTPIEEKDSFRWVEGYRKTSELARSVPECEVFSISNREGDIFEVLKVKGNSQMCSRSARTVSQSVRAMKVTPRVPYRKGRKLKEVSFWAVLAEEIGAPEGDSPIHWLLLTSKEITTFEEAEWKSACAVVKRSKSAGEPTLSELIRIIGKLGGHLGRKGDGMPGPQCIWQGLARVRDFAIAWQVFSEQ